MAEALHIIKFFIRNIFIFAIPAYGWLPGYRITHYIIFNMTHQKRYTPLTAKRKQLLEEDAEWIADEYFEPDELVRPEVIAEAEEFTYSLGDYNNDFKGLIHYFNGRFHVYLDTTFGKKLSDTVIRYSFAYPCD